MFLALVAAGAHIHAHKCMHADAHTHTHAHIQLGPISQIKFGFFQASLLKRKKMELCG